jgi:6-phosphogluconate dehydrogenase
MMRAFERQPELPNLMLDGEFLSWLQRSEPALRRLISLAVAGGIPVPALSASLSYFDSYRSAKLPQNLTQAQRDFFGAHAYQRADRPSSGAVHTDWVTMLPASSTPAGER